VPQIRKAGRLTEPPFKPCLMAATRKVPAATEPPPLFQGKPRRVMRNSGGVPGPRGPTGDRNYWGRWGNAPRRSRVPVGGIRCKKKPRRTRRQTTECSWPRFALSPMSFLQCLPNWPAEWLRHRSRMNATPSRTNSKPIRVLAFAFNESSTTAGRQRSESRQYRSRASGPCQDAER